MALERLKNQSDLSPEELEEIGRLEKLLADEDETSDGPTGDKWIDDFLQDEDDEDYNWTNEVDGKPNRNQS